MKAIIDTNILLEIASELHSYILYKRSMGDESENLADYKINKIIKALIRNNQLVGSSIVTEEFNRLIQYEKFEGTEDNGKSIKNAIRGKIASGNSIQYSSKFNINLPIDLEQQNDTKIYLSFADATQGDEEGLIITRDHHFLQIKNKFIGRYNHVMIKKPNKNLTNIYDFNENFSNSLAGKILKKIYEMKAWFIK